MKAMKRMVSLMLSMILTLVMSCTVLASGSISAEPPGVPEDQSADLTGHTFTAYQIFRGATVSDKSTVAADTLKEIEWGENIQAEKFVTALKDSMEFGTTNPFASIRYDENAPYKSAENVVRVVQNWKSDDISGDKLIQAVHGELRAFARIADANRTGKGSEEGTRLEPGFYLVVDETIWEEAATDTVRNLSFLQVSTGAPFAMVNKTDVPEMEKKVLEVNDSTGRESWEDAADYDIGDDVAFMLTGTMPSDYASYQKHYKYVFHDILSAGLGEPKDIIVRIDGREVASSGYTKVHTSSGTTAEGSEGDHFLTITFENLKADQWKTYGISDKTVITVEYKAKLLREAGIGEKGNENRAYLEYSNDPNYTGDGTDPEDPPGTGHTPEDKVIIFTYQLIANKMDKDQNPLEGAGFALFKYDHVTQEYQPVPVEGSIPVYMEGGGSEASGTGNADYYEIKGDGITTFAFKGVDQGSYRLVESTVPDGYNRVDDMYFDVVAVFDEKDPQKLLDLKIESVTDGRDTIVAGDGKTPVFSFEGKVSDGSLSCDVINLKGRRIPSTGGIGTTIFYLTGTVMAAGAGVLLVVRRRMRRRR